MIKTARENLPVSATMAAFIALGLATKCAGSDAESTRELHADTQVDAAPAPVDPIQSTTRTAVNETMEGEHDDTGEIPDGSFTLNDLKKSSEFLKRYEADQINARAWREKVVVPSVENALTELDFEIDHVKPFPATIARFRDAEGDLIMIQFNSMGPDGPKIIDHGEGRITPLIAVGSVQVQNPDGKWQHISMGRPAAPYNLLADEISKALEGKYDRD